MQIGSRACNFILIEFTTVEKKEKDDQFKYNSNGLQKTCEVKIIYVIGRQVSYTIFLNWLLFDAIL